MRPAALRLAPHGAVFLIVVLSLVPPPRAVTREAVEAACFPRLSVGLIVVSTALMLSVSPSTSLSLDRKLGV